jgi:DUF971 family protein
MMTEKWTATMSAATPTDLHLDRNDGLRIEWSDGRCSHYALVYLRRRCPCAACRTRKPEPEPEPASTGGAFSLTVLPQGAEHAAEFTAAALVGNYALRIDWADGHKTGIYDFQYLRSIDPNGEKA